MPTLTVALQSFGTNAPDTRRALLDQARAADEAGADRILVVDHVVMADETASYPWGTFLATPQTSWPEPAIVLAAAAAATERVRLATGILVAPLRPAALLAKSIATLDVLSGGRVDLGVGTGWHRAEFDAVGASFDDRARLLTETIAACRALWETAPATYHGQHVAFDEVWCLPQPLQTRLPVWFSGRLGTGNLRRITTLGDGWLPPPNATADDVADALPILRESWSAAGRDGSPGVQMRVGVAPGDDGRPDLSAAMGEVARVTALGATDVRMVLEQLCPRPDTMTDDLAAAVHAFHDTVG